MCSSSLLCCRPDRQGHRPVGGVVVDAADDEIPVERLRGQVYLVALVQKWDVGRHDGRGTIRLALVVDDGLGGRLGGVQGVVGAAVVDALPDAVLGQAVHDGLRGRLSVLVLQPHDLDPRDQRRRADLVGGGGRVGVLRKVVNVLVVPEGTDKRLSSLRSDDVMVRPVFLRVIQQRQDDVA